MKALWSSRARGPGFRLAEVPVPEIGPTDVLIRVEKAGVCGTDHHIYDWDAWAQNRIKPPLVVGHEFMGRVAASATPCAASASANASRAEGHIADLTCLLCRTGQAHICERVKIIGVDRDGAFANTLRCPNTTCGGSIRRSPTNSPRSSIRSATRCTPSWRRA